MKIPTLPYACQNRPNPTRARGQRLIERNDTSALYAEHAKPAKTVKKRK